VQNQKPIVIITILGPPAQSCRREN